MSFKTLKRKRPDVAALVNKVEAEDPSKQRKVDTRYWYPQRDQAGNAYAVIRFLPGLSEDGVAWARYWDHGFQGPSGQWYIESSLTTLDQEDPVSQLNIDMWNNYSKYGLTEKEAQRVVRTRKRQLNYVMNVYIISDPANPENEGQVRLFRFGKKIFDKIMEAMKPQFPDETPFVPFDMWDGADFVLKIRAQEMTINGKKRNVPNYDNSSWKTPATLLDADDSTLEEIYNKQYDLSDLNTVMPNKFKSYDELKARLDSVLGVAAAPATAAAAAAVGEQAEAPSVGKTAEEPKIATAEDDLDEDDDAVDQTDDDEAMKYFADLVKED